MLGQFGAEIKQLSLVPSSGGVFDVVVDGELLFSRKQQGRFPTNDEIGELLRKKLTR